jgi:hypothetical protein
MMRQLWSFPLYTLFPKHVRAQRWGAQPMKLFIPGRYAR